MGIGSSSSHGSNSKVSLPSLSNVKSLTTFAEYPLNTLSQINEAYQYYCQSPEYANHIPVMAIHSFEETFGQLFPDPVVQFYALQQGQGNALLSAASAFASAMSSTLVRSSGIGSANGGSNASHRVKKILTKGVVNSSGNPGSTFMHQGSFKASAGAVPMVPSSADSNTSKPSSRSTKERSKLVLRPQSQLAMPGFGNYSNIGTPLSAGSVTTSSASERGGAGGSVVILDVFYIFTMFCDAGIREKLYYLCAINTDMDVTSSHLRLDALQLMIYRILQAVANVCRITVPPREDVYSFLDYSIKQFMERNASVAAASAQQLVPHTSGKHSNQSGKHQSNSAKYSNSTQANLQSNQPINKPDINNSNQSKGFSFRDFWQWCQDVNQISTYLDAIDSLCRVVMMNVDRSYKGRQYMVLRNSVLNSSFSIGSGSIKDSNRLQQTLREIVTHLQQEDMTTLAFQHRHPTWQYSFRDMVNEHWFGEFITTTTVEDKTFTALEHMILSNRKAIPVFAHPNVITNMNTALSAAHAAAGTAGAGAGAGTSVSGSDAGGPTGLASSLVSSSPAASQRNSVSSNAGARMGSISIGGSRANSLAVGANRFGSVSASTPKGSISFANIAAMNAQNAGTGQFGMHALVQTAQKDPSKFQLIGAIDLATILSWVVICAPEKVLAAYKKKEEEEREKRLKAARIEAGEELDDEEENNGEPEEKSPEIEIEPEKELEGTEFSEKGKQKEKGKGKLGRARTLSDDKADGDTIGTKKSSKASKDKDSSKNSSKDKDASKDDVGNPLDANSSIEGGASTATLGSGSGVNSSQSAGGDRFSMLGGFRFKQRNKNVNEFRSQWQTMGEESAYSPLFTVYTQLQFPMYHRRYDLTCPAGYNHVYYLDQPVYNAIALYASGIVKYIPIGQNRIPGSHGNVNTAPNRLLHLLEPFEIAGFLYDHFDEFFIHDYSYHSSEYGGGAETDKGGKSSSLSPGKHRSFLEPESPTTDGPSLKFSPTKNQKNNANHIMNRSIMQCGLIKEPIIIDKDVNIGTAFYILLKSKLDACLVLDEKGKVGCILTIYHMEKLWWSWKQQHLQTAINIVNLATLREDYSNGVYSMFPTPVKVPGTSGGANSGAGALRDGLNFSLFSCFMNPLELGHSIGIEVVSFDEFINDTTDLEFSPLGLMMAVDKNRDRGGLNTQSIATVTTATTEDDGSTTIDGPTSMR